MGFIGPNKLFLGLLAVSLPLAAAGNSYGKLPLSFEPNQGQTDARVKSLARASGYTLFVTADEAVFAGRDGSVERMSSLASSGRKGSASKVETPDSINSPAANPLQANLGGSGDAFARSISESLFACTYSNTVCFE